MAYELKQELKQELRLVMTPQLQLAIRLLQLSKLELVDMVRQEVETNPVLEDVSTDDAVLGVEEAQGVKKEEETDWQKYLEEDHHLNAPRLNFSDVTGDDEDNLIGNISTVEGGLSEHLRWQLLTRALSDGEARLGEFIIGNVDEDGYLRVLDRGEESDSEYEAAVVTELARLTGMSPPEVEKVIGIIQGLDPIGVASRTLKECLLIQARHLAVRDTVVEEVIAGHLQELAKKNYKAIARGLGVTVEEVFSAARIINMSLIPAPGRSYGEAEARAILPDVYITKVGDDYVITLNEDGMPKLKINRYYRELLRADGKVAGDAKAYIQDKLKSALWLIKSVHQRQRTIYRVVECIVKFQREFLDKGLKYLKPLVLKDVAGSIGVHESTVSRVTSNKYVETPRGLFELKYFFSNAISNSDGSDVSAEYIKDKVRSIIESEDSLRPYSDKEIAEILRKSGVTLARRTATKYREALGFESSNRRKTHF